ncbi:isoprenylcysteine carboxylmethyltransferase family protein [uncultured Rubinisphaera sp.]|uniref:methyltransferase family protein n=1 Tax=uncultured Rubinisphaera sp. TaxID=1678686 RepID=UPI0030D7EDB6|tara:strand:- start:492 stop:935 length:444 start_codon:yes stop_codon:yes gene_type:complete
MKNWDWKIQMLVVLQFGLSSVIILSTPLSKLTIWNGLGMISGFLLFLWSIAIMKLHNLSVGPVPHQNAKLVTTGPYRILLHPMYTALLILTGSTLIFESPIWRLLMWLALVIVLNFKARYEETFMQEQFQEYEQFKRTRWRFLPYIY